LPKVHSDRSRRRSPGRFRQRIRLQLRDRVVACSPLTGGSVFDLRREWLQCVCVIVGRRCECGKWSPRLQDSVTVLIFKKSLLVYRGSANARSRNLKLDAQRKEATRDKELGAIA